MRFKLGSIHRLGFRTPLTPTFCHDFVSFCIFSISRHFSSEGIEKDALYIPYNVSCKTIVSKTWMFRLKRRGESSNAVPESHHHAYMIVWISMYRLCSSYPSEKRKQSSKKLIVPSYFYILCSQIWKIVREMEGVWKVMRGNWSGEGDNPPIWSLGEHNDWSQHATARLLPPTYWRHEGWLATTGWRVFV